MSGMLLAEGVLNVSEIMSHVAQHIPKGWWINQDTPIWSFPLFSNHILMQMVGAALVVWLLPRAVQMRAGDDEIGRLVPRGFGNAIEALCVAIRKHVAEPNLGKYTDIFLPYLLTAFFFILTCNLLSMLPINAVATLIVGVEKAHYVGGNPFGNIYVTATLAIITLVMMVYNGLRYHGMDYVKHFFMGPPYLAWFIAILETFGLIFKTIALAVRLFANMIAGHIVLAALLGFVGAIVAATNSQLAGIGVAIPVILASIVLNFLELLVSFLQPFIFILLTAVFVGMSVNIHHDDHHEEHGHDAHGHAGHGHDAHGSAAASAAHG